MTLFHFAVILAWEYNFTILSKYEAGSFDGMTDSYSYHRTAWNEVFGSTKYAHGQRTTTKALVLKALDAKGFSGDNRIRIEEYGDSAAVRSDDRGLEHWANDAVSNYDDTKPEPVNLSALLPKSAGD